MHSRRLLQERKSYLSTKEEESRQEHKKEELKRALKECKPIPHHLRGDAKEILDEIIYNNADSVPEYLPPRIAVTTSHSPSSSLKMFAKHISLVFNGQMLIRGNQSYEKLDKYCQDYGITHLIILTETKGNPTSLTLCRYPQGPTYSFSLFNLKFQRRVRSFGEKVQLVLDGMDSVLGKRLCLDLSLCFPKISEGNRLLAMVNRGGTIAFRHFFIDKRKLEKDCEFDLKLYKVVNSTFNVSGNVDYALRAYTNAGNDDILKEEAEEDE